MDVGRKLAGRVDEMVVALGWVVDRAEGSTDRLGGPIALKVDVPVLVDPGRETCSLAVVDTGTGCRVDGAAILDIVLCVTEVADRAVWTLSDLRLARPFCTVPAGARSGMTMLRGRSCRAGGAAVVGFGSSILE
jgi:hypothetical protein